MATSGTAGFIRDINDSTSRSCRTGRSTRDSARFELGSSMANSTNCSNLKHGYNSSADGYIPGKLPLPNDYFPVPQLSAKENRYLLGLAKHACKEVVYYSRHHDGPMKWLHLTSVDGVDVFQGVDISGTHASQQEAKALTYLRGSCKIHATIDEISEFFKPDTPEKLSGFTQSVGKDLLDQKTLLTLATPTLDNPKHFVAVKWTAVESPSKLARNRDFCYIECHDEFIDANTKRRGWVQSMHSIRLPFCPPLTQSHNLVRGSFYRSGYIFTESAEKGFVDAVHTLHVDIKGNAPNWLKILTMKRRITNIAHVNHYFQRQRLTHEPLLGEMDLPPKDLVTRCQLCDTRFGFFHRRRLCRKCGKVVCNACGTEFVLDPATKVRICFECSEFGGSVPMMADSGLVVDVDKQEDRETARGADETMIYLETRPDEHEYFFDDEDVHAVTESEAAKHSNLQFEKLLDETSEEMDVRTELRQFALKPMASFELKGAFGKGISTSFSAMDLEDPRRTGFVRSASEDFLPLEFKRTETRGKTKFHSMDDGMKLNLFNERSRSRSRSSHEVGYISPPPPCGKIASRSRHNSTEDDQGTFGRKTRTQQYFEARNARLIQLSGQQQYTAPSSISGKMVPSDVGTGIGVPGRCHVPEVELESPSNLKLGNACATRNRQNGEGTDSETEAFRLAMSAMRLYEEERGPTLHVAKKTRQAALAKMMEVYAREIKQSQSKDFKPYSRDTFSDLRRVHHDVEDGRPLRRTFGDDRPPYDDLPLQVTKLDERPLTSKRLSCREDLYAPTLPLKPKASEEVYEYRDLSDLSTSAFQAYQRSSRGSIQVPVENSESDDMHHQTEVAQPLIVHFQRDSIRSTPVHTESDTSGLARYNSMGSSDIVTRLLQPNSMFEVAESDTFSDVDFTDLPHLMCMNGSGVRAGSSFTDLQHWTKEQSSENGGLEYAQEPRLSDLLSSLHLDDVQHVDDDDSDSQSSTASSQIDWQTTISNKVPLGHRRAAAVPHQNEAISSLIIKNKLSESMAPQNEDLGFYQQYSKLPSLSDLLSELCESDRSSLPSYLEFGGSHSELEPEYLEAIANASNEMGVSMQGERQRRQSSIPSELEAMASREVYT